MNRRVPTALAAAPLAAALFVAATILSPAQDHVWHPNSENLGSFVTSLATLGDGTVAAGVAGSGVFVSTDRGATFSAVGSDAAPTDVTALSAGPDDRLYAGTSNGVYSIPTGGLPGGTWSQTLPGMTVEAMIHRVGGDLFVSACSPCDVLRTADGSQYDNGNFSRQASAFALTNSGLVVAATPSHGVWLGTRGGTTWNPIDSTIVGIISAAVTTNGSILIGLDNVLRTTTGGAMWDTVLRSSVVTAIASSLGTDIYAATGDGVYRSIDDGVSWRPMNNGLGEDSAQVTTLRIAADGTVYAATYTGMVYRLELLPTSVDRDGSTAGVDVRLRVGENPTSEVSHLTVELSRPAAHARLRITDMRGRIVATPIDGSLPAGRHDVTFDPPSSGVYLAELHAGSIRRTVRLVVVKR